MFEGKTPKSLPAQPRGEGTASGDGLRAISWEDLVARLSAAHDLRVEDHGCPQPRASFDAGSASRIAALQHDENRINHDASSNRKHMGGKNLPARETPDPAN